MTRTRRALALLLAIVLCIAAIHAWWPAAVPAKAGEPAETATPDSVERAPTPAPATAPTAPAPGATTLGRADASALADLAPTLQARADAGDAQAACRLGTDLLRCQYLAQLGEDQLERLADQEKAHTERGKLEAANSAAMMLLRHAELQRTCAGLDEDLIARGGHYLRQAALAGEPDAVVRYATGGAFAITGSTAYIATPEFDQWRREAPGMVQRALEAGQPGAVLLLLHSHSTNHYFLPWLTPHDPDAAEASLALARRLFGEGAYADYFDIPVRDDPQHRAEAERRAAELHARYFDGARQDFAAAVYGLIPLHDIHGYGGGPLPGITVPVGQGCRPRSEP